VKHLGIAAVVLLSSSLANAEPLFRYVVTEATLAELGLPAGGASVAVDINNTGYVVGYTTDASGLKQAAAFIGTGAFVLYPALGTGDNEATGTNDARTVVGNFTHDGHQHAFVAMGGSPVALMDDQLFRDRVVSTATAISNTGFVVGSRRFRDRPGMPLATLWSSPAAFHFIHGDAVPSVVLDVNNEGDSTGSLLNGVDSRVFWNVLPSGAIAAVRIPLPADTSACHYHSGSASGLNNEGIVVGYVKCTVEDGRFLSRAMHWNGHGANSTDLGLLPGGIESVAEDINDANFVVGYADRPVSVWGFLSNAEVGVLFHPHFGMYALPRPAWVPWDGRCRALALNERKDSTGLIQVVGYCNYTSSRGRAVRWDVTVAKRSTVPPGTSP
jgi:uncharacterized membrane protein